MISKYSRPYTFLNRMGQSFGLCARKFLSFFPRNALTRRGTNFSVFTMMEASATYPTAEASIPTVDLTDVAEEEPEEEEEEELRFLGSIKCQIVGIRYYRGEAHPGEYVKLVREPNNPYDRNAIRVENLSGEKVGHIKKEQAAALTPIMDGSLDVKLDGTIPYAGNQWNLPLMLEFYGKEASLAVEVGRMLKRHRIGLQQSPLFNASTNTTAANNKPSVVVQKKKLDWRTQQKQLDDLFDQQSKSQLSNLPRVNVPALQVELFPHQVDGIRWMCHRETGNIEPPFFRQVKEQNKTMWLSEITQSSQSTPPTPVVGGILAGKTFCGRVFVWWYGHTVSRKYADSCSLHSVLPLCM